MVLFYNATKEGVPTVDRYKEHYAVSRISNRWLMTVFYLNILIVEHTGSNGYIIFKEKVKDTHLVRRDFLKSLSTNLCKDICKYLCL